MGKHMRGSIPRRKASTFSREKLQEIKDARRARIEREAESRPQHPNVFSEPIEVKAEVQ